ncbi:MAG: phosphoribosylanthranilate isomerase [Natronincolaceae bacterium]|jgi:phosphoribosylanthranilate isomerase
MTKIKLCGLSSPCDIKAANDLKVDFIGFVFALKSRRYLTPKKAAELKKLLHPDIKAVGVFVNESIHTVAGLLNGGTIEIAQLHGNEDEDYIKQLRALTGKLIIKAFHVGDTLDVTAIRNSSADYMLLDSGSGGTGMTFDWKLIQGIYRPYFLAGGLDAYNVRSAIDELKPYAVDVSSGIETNGIKDFSKMKKFISAAKGA